MTTTGIYAAGAGMKMMQKSVSVNGKASGGSSFADMVNASLANGKCDKPAAAAENKTPAKENAVVNASDRKMADSGKPDGVQDAGMQEKTDAAAGDVGAQENIRTGDLQNLEPEELEAVLDKICEEIRKLFEIEDEELTAVMEQLGITAQQLVMPNVLGQLAVAVAGEKDVSAVLTNEELAAKLTQLMQSVEDILKSAEVTPEAVLESMPEQLPVQSFGQMEEQASEVKSASKNEADRDMPEQENASADSAGNHIEFEAVKETERGQSGQQNTRQQNSSQTQTTSQADQFVQMVSEHAPQQISENGFSELTVAEQIRQIADQILEKVRVVINPSHTSMELTLNPESLGKVNLNIVSRQGSMTAQFTVQNEVAKEAVESQITVLRENLEKQGLKVDAIEVTVSDFEFFQNSQAGNSSTGQGQQRRRRNLTLEEMDAIPDITEAENIVRDMMERNGNQVDYTA